MVMKKQFKHNEFFSHVLRICVILVLIFIYVSGPLTKWKAISLFTLILIILFLIFRKNLLPKPYHELHPLVDIALVFSIILPILGILYIVLVIYGLFLEEIIPNYMALVGFIMILLGLYFFHLVKKAKNYGKSIK